MHLDPAVVTRLSAGRAGAVARATLVAAGADDAWIRRQVAAGRWQRLHQGVLVAYSGPLTWRTRAWGAVLYAGPGAALSHAAAAYRHGFATGAPRVIDVTVPDSRRVLPSPGLHVHVRRGGPVAGGRPPTVSRGDAVVDLVAATTCVDDAVGWVCAAVRAGTRPVEITRALARRRTVRHAALLRELVAEVAAGIESPLERRYHRDVEGRHGLPRARLQVREVVGGLWIRADAWYEGFGVRVELDGNLGHPGGRTDSDTWRDNVVLLTRRELTLRYRWRHAAIASCATAGQVATALRLGGWTGTLRPCGPGCSADAGRGGRPAA